MNAGELVRTQIGQLIANRAALLNGELALRMGVLLIGVIGCGVAFALILRSGFGAAPILAVSEGLSHITHISVGTTCFIVGAVLLSIWAVLRIRPGIGTICDAALLGVAIDVTLRLVPEPLAMGERVLLLLAGVILYAASTALYVGSNLGGGPMDGLVVGLVARTGLSVTVVRIGFEVILVAGAWMLGGTVGVGTVLCAFAVGPIITLILRLVPKHIVAQSGWASTLDREPSVLARWYHLALEWLRKSAREFSAIARPRRAYAAA